MPVSLHDVTSEGWTELQISFLLHNNKQGRGYGGIWGV